MPRKPKAKPVAPPAIPAELLEQFSGGPMTAEAINAATLVLKKALIERALGGELHQHLDYPPGAAKPATVTNRCNGSGTKAILTDHAADLHRSPDENINAQLRKIIKPRGHFPTDPCESLSRLEHGNHGTPSRQLDSTVRGLGRFTVDPVT